MTKSLQTPNVDWSHLIRDSLQSRPVLELPRRLKLPILPQSVIAFTEVAENPDAGPHELAAPLVPDSALTAELLRHINSVAIGLKQKVASVPQAIGLLGARRTKMLVLTSALQTATKNTTSRLIHTNQFQRDSYVRALFAHGTAEAIGADAETAYIAGLLQDLLLPILTEAFYFDYRRILGQGSELIERERERFGWDHASVAANLIREWGFPDELIAAVLFHHDPDKIILLPKLRQTSLVGSVAAASLPEVLRQSPYGFDVIVALQDVVTDFRALEIAVAVDEECDRQGLDVNLTDRLHRLATECLEQRRFDRVHCYRKLGNYTLEDQIGEGGMGVVFQARHCMLKRPSAIKLLHSSKIGPESYHRFESEVQLTCALTSPHTVAVYDYGVTEEGLFYYVMEYLDGITLAQLVQREGPQSDARVINFLQQACLSLSEAHANGLIHRDLKPENLMVCCRGGVADTIKVLDFGLARVVNKQLNETDPSASLAGTPRYMSPEAIVNGHGMDARSDLYSLGAVGYFLLTGQPVFTNRDLVDLLKSHVHTKPEAPSARLGRPIDPGLEKLILQCLEKSRERRPPSAQDLYRLLGQCRSAKQSPATDYVVSRTSSPTIPSGDSETEVDELGKTYIPEGFALS